MCWIVQANMICTCGCKRRFTPEKPWAKYATKECGDAARHKRYRARLKKRGTRN